MQRVFRITQTHIILCCIVVTLRSYIYPGETCFDTINARPCSVKKYYISHIQRQTNWKTVYCKIVSYKTRVAISGGWKQRFLKTAVHRLLRLASPDGN